MFEGLAPWLNRVPGRLMHTTILGCGIFGSVSGSSAATCATISKVALPELLRRGYDEKIALGSLATAGTLGILIPPSITMVVYAVAADASIIRVFLAGFLPGLLLMGDAAHVMSPVGGVGINYAIQDAAAAANLLSAQLKRGVVTLDDLRAVQRRREWPTRFIQRIQATAQRIIGNALNTNQMLKPPLLLRLLLRVPLLRDVPARVLAFGFWPVHLKK